MYVIEIDLESADLNSVFSFRIMETGPQGADGKTPIKGVDYFTEEDKAELINGIQIGSVKVASIPIEDIQKLL